MKGITQARGRFFINLFSTVFALRGRFNYLNLSRFGSYCERTYRRHFEKGFDFSGFNFLLLKDFVKPQACIAVVDCCFSAKSGKKTWGLDKFWSSVLGKAAKGIEISCIAIVDLAQNTAFSISAAQTPSGLPDEQTRVDFYLRQIKAVAHRILHFTCYVAADGFYAKKKFVSGLLDLGFQIICKLRRDADLRFIFDGEHKKRRGRRRKYAGKVDFHQTGKFDYVTTIIKDKSGDEDEHKTAVYTKVVYSITLKRNIRVVLLYRHSNKSYCVLFSTDTTLGAKKIYSWYKSRFQIEFLFRDAKQYAGFSHSQSVKKQALGFHFNASLTAINLAKAEIIISNYGNPVEVFSIAKFKRAYEQAANVSYFIKAFELNKDRILNHPAYEKIIGQWKVAA